MWWLQQLLLMKRGKTKQRKQLKKKTPHSAAFNTIRTHSYAIKMQHSDQVTAFDSLTFPRHFLIQLSIFICSETQPCQIITQWNTIWPNNERANALTNQRDKDTTDAQRPIETLFFTAGMRQYKWRRRQKINTECVNWNGTLDFSFYIITYMPLKCHWMRNDPRKIRVVLYRPFGVNNLLIVTLITSVSQHKCSAIEIEKQTHSNGVHFFRRLIAFFLKSFFFSYFSLRKTNKISTSSYSLIFLTMNKSHEICVFDNDNAMANWLALIYSIVVRTFIALMTTNLSFEWHLRQTFGQFHKYVIQTEIESHVK